MYFHCFCWLSPLLFDKQRKKMSLVFKIQQSLQDSSEGKGNECILFHFFYREKPYRTKQLYYFCIRNMPTFRCAL
jgi:cytochrome c oxidase assembly protein Cox11